MERTSQFSLKRAGEPPGRVTKGSVEEMGFLAGTEIFDFAHKITRIAELAVDGGESDIGDIVHLLEAFHDLFADSSGRNFSAILLF